MNFLSKTSTVAVIAILILAGVGYMIYSGNKKTKTVTGATPANPTTSTEV